MITIGIILCFALLLIDFPLFILLGGAIIWAWPLWLSIIIFIIDLLIIESGVIAIISFMSILLCLPIKATIEAIIKLVKKGK